ncbi:Muscarinic acetylcholine receptor M5 [Echinococcus granulosus]|uniref:Muscarinic acetylcholine receptor M5 n=2 Tax=Echinococcus granulosus TaxID=6210 RepID=W6VCA5_ECHGR|nr:Muscarinic acetylcholine receptor M5 [Echinococcus granulosus]EUB64484.1 Muscarinic acetylcholine receptor M5 [Echinococcus granulosus]
MLQSTSNNFKSDLLIRYRQFRILPNNTLKFCCLFTDLMDDYSTYKLPVKVVLGILSSLVSLCCILGNLLVLVAFCVDRGVRASNNYFIISLAVTDLTIGLISLNLLILYLLLGYWPLGNFICDCWLAIDFTACLVSQVTVFLITLDRFMSVKFPVKYRNWRSENKLRVMLALSWVLPAALWIPMVFAWYEITGEVRPPSDQCNVPFTHYTAFNTILTISYFWIPLCFMISLYVGIYRTAVKLHHNVHETHRGLADLVLMAGTTMSKIGLSVRVSEPQSRAKPRAPPEKDAEQPNHLASQKLDAKDADLSHKNDSGLNKQVNMNSSLPQLQTEHQTEFIDSGLGESNNMRTTSDLGLGCKQRSSSLSLEMPEFCDHYRCILSPNAPPSRGSSVLSESIDPWTRQNGSKSPSKFEGHCKETLKNNQKNIDRTENTTGNTSETRPTLQPHKEEKKSKAMVPSFLRLRLKIVKPKRKESSSFAKTENSSTDSAKPQGNNDSKNNHDSNNNSASRKNVTNQGSIRDRFVWFRNQKSAEKGKVERRKRKRARKALRMISFILGAFVICWTPYHIIIIIKGFCDIPSQGYSCIDVHLYNFAYYMCYMNSPINPFCYAMANIAFKRAFLRILDGDFRKT